MFTTQIKIKSSQKNQDIKSYLWYGLSHLKNLYAQTTREEQIYYGTSDGDLWWQGNI